MDPLSPEALRASFVNCSKGDAKRMPVPSEAALPPASRWAELDFFGWRDPGHPQAAWMVVGGDVVGQGEPVGIAMKVSSAGSAGRKNMCTLCFTTHSASDMALLVAPLAGPSGRRGNTVGNYVCADLACSLYARGLKRPARAQPHETISVEAKVERLRANLVAFVRRVVAV
ncbi:FBP domain-containing protein [Nocardioides yefusunii]|uniref:FBP domain-containing protein n=1 Tax=Nocardioides yefusunii TaxID=2500546 RepID=A0ABW1R1C9_9ACTN|nr:FBP domain-containing protein [Nocardioides yefusunii]